MVDGGGGGDGVEDEGSAMKLEVEEVVAGLL